MQFDSKESLLAKINQLQLQLDEANETLEAIRTGQVDAFVISGQNGRELYTLKTADHAYRAFIEQMSEGAVTLNSSGLITYCNSKFANIVAAPLAQVLGTEFSRYIDPDSKKSFAKLFKEAWSTALKKEINLIATERLIPVLLSVNKLDLDEDVALSVIVTDLTEQKQNEKQLQLQNEQLEVLNKALMDSNHDLQQFASVASHDLQEPLRKIHVFSKFIKDRAFHELSDQTKQYIEKIITASQRMKVLIVDILNYSKLSASEQNFEAIDLTSLVNEILEDFDLKIIEKNALIQLGTLPTIEANKGQMRQVFNNLISNALKFSKIDNRPEIIISLKQIAAGELGVSLTNEVDYCCVSIKDNGIGFDEHFALSIFNLFEKLNPNAVYEGSGIGLAIAKKIIDRHHGLIIAKSAEGQGAEFNIILPLKQRKH